MIWSSKEHMHSSAKRRPTHITCGFNHTRMYHTRSFYKGSGEWLKTLLLCDATLWPTVMAEVNAEAKREEGSQADGAKVTTGPAE